MNRWDAGIIALAIAGIGLSFQATDFSLRQSQQAIIRIDRQPSRFEPLSPDRQLQVTGKLGNSLIEIHGHAIRFVDSPCTGKVCIHSGWLRHSGQVIACLPNRVSIYIPGIDPEFDAINF